MKKILYRKELPWRGYVLYSFACLSVKPHTVVDVPSPPSPTQICVEVHENDLKFMRKKQGNILSL